ncbi:MAG: hypothetical protein CW338_00300 [Clostridiales bacterium]|nr:hypothetical protein [Clostridiales bacterium]
MSKITRAVDSVLSGCTDLAEKILKKIFKEKMPGALDSREKIAEIVNYLIFGVLTTLVSLVTYFIAASVLGVRKAETPEGDFTLWQRLAGVLFGVWITPDSVLHGSTRMIVLGLVCQLISWICAVLFAFVTNKVFVFRSTEKGGRALRELGRFALARVVSFILIELIVYALLFVITGPAAAKIISTVLVVIFNYFASKLAVFRKRAAADTDTRGENRID